VVSLAVGRRVRGQEPGRSTGASRKADGWIIVQRRDGFHCHVAGTPNRPIIVLLEQDRADEADDGYRSGSTPDAYDDETTALSLGKMATTWVRRLISPLRCSIGLVECSLVRYGGNVM
jgi:hypothetical protein